jgi:hypothetical protein
MDFSGKARISEKEAPCDVAIERLSSRRPIAAVDVITITAI